MVVVDTNILAYLLISGDRTDLARALAKRDPDWKSDAFALIEFSNILATYERRGGLDRAQAERLQNDAETVLRGLVNIPHLTALETARRFGVSAYDARFLATAEKLGSRLVTEDAKLRSAAPTLTLSLAESLGAR
jgi:predicted nucleic acid-binding protein